VGNTKVPSKATHSLCATFEESPKNAYIFGNFIFGRNPCSLEVQHLQPSINRKSCAPTGAAGYPKPKKAPSLRPISQQSPKKGHFYYIRTQVFAAY
jgi:hypothetical protein